MSFFSNLFKSSFSKQLEKAAKGDAIAQYQVGLAYYDGQGTSRDLLQATIWWKKSADQGNIDAIYNLGVCYANGQGVEQDDAKALEFFHKAAQHNIPEAYSYIGNRIRFGTFKPTTYVADIEKNMEAAEWFSKGCSLGDQACLVNLRKLCEECHNQGLRLRDGLDGFDINIEESIKWYALPVKYGFVPSQFDLGVIYYNQGNRKDAEKWFVTAAENGWTDAMVNLGKLYATGWFGSADVDSADMWLDMAARQGDQEAKQLLMQLRSSK